MRNAQTREQLRSKRRLQLWAAIVGMLIAVPSALDSLSTTADSTTRVLHALAYLVGGAVIGALAATIAVALRR